MTIDYTLHLSDIALFLTGIIAFFKVFLAVRDVLRDHETRIKNVATITSRLDGEVYEHRDWLIRAGLDRRQVERRAEERKSGS